MNRKNALTLGMLIKSLTAIACPPYDTIKFNLAKLVTYNGIVTKRVVRHNRTIFAKNATAPKMYDIFGENWRSIIVTSFRIYSDSNGYHCAIEIEDESLEDEKLESIRIEDIG